MINYVDCPPKFNSSPLKMDGWNTSFLLGWPIFRGCVSKSYYIDLYCIQHVLFKTHACVKVFVKNQKPSMELRSIFLKISLQKIDVVLFDQ